MHSSPLGRYQQLLEAGTFRPDAEQLQAVTALDQLWRDLIQPSKPGWLQRVFGKHASPVRGLYLWGGVGRGKTWLMDLFFECLPEKGKQRVHFHRFMQRIHLALKEEGNARDPLPRIARRWSEECRVLCLDEFFVSDIADAMLLGTLLENLFENGVTLVTTSNIEPDGLYADGLQRAKFLPAIDLLKEHTRVLELAGTTDFRLRILQQSEIWHHPLDEQADEVLANSFDRMAADCSLSPELMINGRTFSARKRGDGIIWFEFEELCGKPRGSIDYIEIAKAFNTVFLSQLPQMGANDSDAARRFITLVDEFYDRNVKLLITAETAIDDIYTGNKLEFEFRRTTSRLTEMQSTEYLARPHLA